MKRTMTDTEQILEDAEVTATYLRALIANGVPYLSAVSLASSYVSARQIARSVKTDPPREPWEDL